MTAPITGVWPRVTSRIGFLRPRYYATASSVSTESFVIYFLAERVGFEPTDLLQSTVFKTVAIDQLCHLSVDTFIYPTHRCLSCPLSG